MRRRSSAFIGICLLGALGFFISLSLIEKHVAARAGGGGGVDEGLCSALTIFSCEETATSAVSEVGGLPLAVVGAGYYLAVLLLAGLLRFGARIFTRVPGVLVGSSVLAVLGSFALFVFSLTTLGKLCPLCLALYGVNGGLLLASLYVHDEGRKAAWAQALRPWHLDSVAGLLALIVGVTSVQVLVYAPAKRAARSADKGMAPLSDVPVAVDLSGAPRLGPEGAAVVIVEFSDFQCPYCQGLSSALEEVVGANTDVALHFRHFPMDDACNPLIKEKFHESACGAATAAVCADDQGKFWPFHDAMFREQAALTRPDLEARALELGLDVARFQTCLDATATKDRLKRDLEQGVALHIQGTPTFYVNGLRYVGGKTREELEILVQRARDSKVSAGSD